MMHASPEELGYASVAVDGFEAVECLGAGSHCLVFAGVSSDSSEKVALKIFDPECSDYFDNECDILHKLASCVRVPRIVDIQHNVLVLSPLGQKVSPLRQPLMYSRKAANPRWLFKSQIATLVTTVEDMHRLQVVHRDIKPDNVVVSGEDVVLIDFDIACHGVVLIMDRKGETSSAVSASDDFNILVSTLGTPEYFDPLYELNNNIKTVRNRSDLMRIDLRCLIRTIFTLVRKWVPPDNDFEIEAFWAAHLQNDAKALMQVKLTKIFIA
jgi:serine/threonine protein kinase